jgi:hypothetical protein
VNLIRFLTVIIVMIELTSKRTLHRCFVALGLIAMAMALAAIPAGIVLASAKSNMMAMADNSGDLPCHHPCPHCAKTCPDMGSCLLKCFQPLSNVPNSVGLGEHDANSVAPPALSQRIAGTPIPPLLRPPSV